jgi:hypothetical protein
MLFVRAFQRGCAASALARTVAEQIPTGRAPPPLPQGHSGGAPGAVNALAGSAFGQLDARGILSFVTDVVDPAAALSLVRSGEKHGRGVRGWSVREITSKKILPSPQIMGPPGASYP